jgi:hypothetical protein
MRVQVFMAGSIKMTVFWDIVLCSLEQLNSAANMSEKHCNTHYIVSGWTKKKNPCPCFSQESNASHLARSK